jgi:hypothetical protein
MESNMPFMISQKGSGYHWMLDLYERMGLPRFDGMCEALKMSNKARENSQLYSKLPKTKRKRRRGMLRHRNAEQAKRKLWGTKQEFPHSYKRIKLDSDAITFDDDDDSMSDESVVYDDIVASEDNVLSDSNMIIHDDDDCYDDEDEESLGLMLSFVTKAELCICGDNVKAHKKECTSILAIKGNLFNSKKVILAQQRVWNLPYL